jgi:stearoyl-CoA desaturase (delta-9 desaturase)
MHVVPTPESVAPTHALHNEGRGEFFSSFRFWAPVLHVAAFAAIWTGVRREALLFGLAYYLVGMFAVTAGYHRYFAHRAFKTSRTFQFVLALLGTAAFQRGPLWWVSTHRHHHRHSDTLLDPHSPVQKGFLWSHLGWLTSRGLGETDPRMVRDLIKFPELRWLDRYHWVAPLCTFGAAYAVAGPSGLVVGGIWATLALWHGIFAINSLAHVFGSRRFATPDQSRNNWWLAILTLGEGWHNNHHHDMRSARQGFYWWEIDLSYYALELLELLGVVWELRAPRVRRPASTSSAATTVRRAAP